MRNAHKTLKPALKRIALSLTVACLLSQSTTALAQVVTPGVPNPVLTKLMTPQRPVIGQPARITIAAFNAGSVNAENVVITDPLPDNIALTAVSATQGRITVEHSIVTVYVGTLAAGQTVTVTNDVVVLREFAANTPWTNCTGLTYRDGTARLACFPLGPAYGPVSMTTPPSFLPEAGTAESFAPIGLLAAGTVCLLTARRLRRRRAQS